MDTITLCPPLRWSIVDVGLYRGGYPLLRNFRFLSRMNLRTIISMTPEPPSPDLIEFSKVAGIDLLHIQTQRTAPLNAALQGNIVQALNVLIDASRLPVFLHCLDGRRISSLCVLYLRRLQGWSPFSAIAEYWRFQVALRSPIPPQEVEKASREVEKFAGEFSDVIVPEKIPSWLWNGERGMAVPGVKIKYIPPLLSFNNEQGQQQNNNSNISGNINNGGNNNSSTLGDDVNMNNSTNSSVPTHIHSESLGGGGFSVVPGAGSRDSKAITSLSRGGHPEGVAGSGTVSRVQGAAGVGLSSGGGKSPLDISTGKGNSSGGSGHNKRQMSQGQQKKESESSGRLRTYLDGSAPSRSLQALSLHGLEDFKPQSRRTGAMVNTINTTNTVMGGGTTSTNTGTGTSRTNSVKPVLTQHVSVTVPGTVQTRTTHAQTHTGVSSSDIDASASVRCAGAGVDVDAIM